ncbi:MAG: hypothetical protein WCQ99_15350 [Pseudomonadota bacterium]
MVKKKLKGSNVVRFICRGFMKNIFFFSAVFLSLHASSFVYAGCIAGDCRNGTGSYVWDSGNKYEGPWKDGKSAGRGTYIFANGDKYIGDFKEGKMQGTGKYIYICGDVYEGGWQNGKKQGRGVYIHADGSREEGEFNDGLIVQQWNMDVDEMSEPEKKQHEQPAVKDKGASPEAPRSRRDHDIVRPPGE